ncbi:MAG: replication-associated recombination protein A [Bacilli bacterium]
MENNLASKMRPKHINDILGQKHLIGDDKIITKMVKDKKLFSFILYGPSGIGKTSIGTAIVNDIDCEYRFLNAVSNNKNDFEKVFEESRLYGGITLIVDEIHRLNKDKQDILLPKIESGIITLIGLTTANPYHSINKAIRSRVYLFELKSLTNKDIKEGLINVKNEKKLENLKISDKAIDYIIDLSNGDLRYAYSLLELAHFYNKNVTLKNLKELNQSRNLLSDKNEDGFYDQLSALQKSIRGSDVNASIHYLGRLITSGDLEAIKRRLLIIYYEDIGLANPNLGPIVKSGVDSAIEVGLPEGRISLSNIVILMALSPKSNSAYMAIVEALNDIENINVGKIPNTIKFQSQIYKYPHDYKDVYVIQQYMPDNIINKKYYIPKTTSTFETKLKEVNDKLS